MHSLRTSLAVLAALSLLSGTALAEPQLDNGSLAPETDSASVGVGMICNTPQQAERFVALRAGGAQGEQAMKKVNAEARDPRACGIAAIAFVPAATVSTKPVGGHLLQVIRIEIVAGYNGHGWQHITNMVQYAIVEAKGVSI